MTLILDEVMPACAGHKDVDEKVLLPAVKVVCSLLEFVHHAKGVSGTPVPTLDMHVTRAYQHFKSLIRIKDCLSVYGTQRASAKQITAPVMGEEENCTGGLRQLIRTVIMTSVATEGRGTVHHTGA